MELSNQVEPAHTIKRQYIRLDDVLPPLETLVVVIEGSVDPAGVCCQSITQSFIGRLGKEE